MKIRLLLVVYFITVTKICFAQNVITQDPIQTTDKNLENAKKLVVLTGRAILTDMKINNPIMYSQYRLEKKCKQQE